MNIETIIKITASEKEAKKYILENWKEIIKFDCVIINDNKINIDTPKNIVELLMYCETKDN